MRFRKNTELFLKPARVQALPSISSGKKYRILFVPFLVGLLFFVCFLSACDSANGGAEGETSGPEYVPAPVTLSTPNIEGLAETGYIVDTSTLSQGYVSAAGISVARLKFQVSYGDMSYNYDLPNDGTPISCPLNMGDGTYTFTIWQNTSDNRYVELTFPPVTETVALESEFTPYIRPNYFCNYDETSACVAKASALSAGAENQGEVLKNIYN